MIFKGCATALITPFTDKGVDYTAFEEQIEYQIANGISALVVCGTTGEPSTMTKEEKKSVIEACVKTTNKRVPVIAGTGTNCTAESVDLSVEAQRLGVDALLTVTPYYNKCTQNGLVAHFSEIAKVVDLPIMLYNVPPRTNVNIMPETYQKLSLIPNIDSAKEASGDMAHITRCYNAAKSKLNFYSGDDTLTIPILELGGLGLVSVASNLMPKQISAVCGLFFEGKVEEAKKLHEKYMQLIKLLFCEVNPIPVKTAINLAGRKGGKLRLPLTPMEEENVEKLYNEMARLDIV